MEYGGGMNELPYPGDLTAAQWALIEPLLPAPKPKDESGELICARLRMPSFMCSEAASVGACCRVNLLPGTARTVTRRPWPRRLSGSQRKDVALSGVYQKRRPTRVAILARTGRRLADHPCVACTAVSAMV